MSKFPADYIECSSIRKNQKIRYLQVIAVNRFVAVEYTHRYKLIFTQKNANYVIMFCWVMAFIHCWLYAFEV